MSIFKDVRKMHDHYGFTPKMIMDTPLEFLEWRQDFLSEEMQELRNAIAECNEHEIIDALIDIIVVAAGTLDLLDVDGQMAWDEVMSANMRKFVGQKPGRSDQFPDLNKPDDWIGPDHCFNWGIQEPLDEQPPRDKNGREDRRSKSILEEANEIVRDRSHEKERQYGSFPEGMKRAAAIATNSLGKDITAPDMFMILVALKLSRHSYNYKQDNLLDACAYLGALDDYIQENCDV